MITRIFVCATAVLSGWIAVLAGVMLITDRAPAAVVMLPDAAFLSDLPDNVAIVGRTAVSVTLIGPDADFAASLYVAGARLVLPSGLRGCAPLDTKGLSLPSGRTVSATGA